MFSDDENFWLEAVKDVKQSDRSNTVPDKAVAKPRKPVVRTDKKAYLDKQDFSSNSKFLDDNEFGGIDNSTLTKFKREEFRPEAVLDLHGMTESKAFDAVEDFVAKSYNRGLRCIIIITGKGLPHPGDDDDIFATKGILHKSVPQWLNLPHLRAAILIYKHPSAKLGGGGALYILLRRNKNLF